MEFSISTRFLDVLGHLKAKNRKKDPPIFSHFLKPSFITISKSLYRTTTIPGSLSTFTQSEATGGAVEGGEGGGAGVGGGGGDVGAGGPVQNSPSFSLTAHQATLQLILIVILEAFLLLQLHSSQLKVN